MSCKLRTQIHLRTHGIVESVLFKPVNLHTYVVHNTYIYQVGMQMASQPRFLVCA